MNITADWTKVETNAGFSFLLPPTLTAVGGRGVDSYVQRWQSKDLIVHFDYGRFSDPLTLYSRKRNYRSSAEQVGGHDATLVSFERDDGWLFTGVHFANLGKDQFDQTIKLTLVVESGPEVDKELSTKIARSISFQQP